MQSITNYVGLFSWTLKFLLLIRELNVKDLCSTGGRNSNLFIRTMYTIRFLFTLTSVKFDNVDDRTKRDKCDTLALNYKFVQERFPIQLYNWSL